MAIAKTHLALTNVPRVGGSTSGTAPILGFLASAYTLARMLHGACRPRHRLLCLISLC
ncbi:hypothetical protein P692DRAFT_20826195 [Suillus brevipes Sb2]|nr:hypothetical protein P692DRAFT_20826195 [Suillus brevipes Sb2]